MACKTKKRSMGLGGVLTSAASGASSGAALGPYGALAGAGLGLVTGLIQEKRDEDTLYQQKRQNTAQQRIQNTSLNPVLNTNMPLMPYGGMIQGEPVELEQGEVFRTPDGMINSISTNAPSHAQGGVPMAGLPADTEVLGKKKIMGKEFKELGRKLEKAQSKYLKTLEKNPTSIASNTAKRSLENISKQYNVLFDLQGEDTGVNKMPDGGTVPASYKADSTITANFRPKAIKTQDYGDFEDTDYGYLLKSIPLYDPKDRNNIIQTENYYKGIPGPIYLGPGDTGGAYVERYTTPEGDIRFAGSEVPITEYANGGKINIKPSKRGTFTAAATKHGKSVQGFASQVLNNKDNYSSAMVKKANFARNASKWKKGADGLKINHIQADITDSINTPYINNTSNSTSNSTSFNLPNFSKGVGDVLNTASTLAPVAYNIGKGLQSPEQLNAPDYYNPYNDQVRATIANRRYNVQPELEANQLAEATYYRNLREGAPSQAQYLGGLQAGQIATQRADATALARKQNIDNQYLAEQAQTDASLGRDMANVNYQIADVNARSRANQRNLLGTGLGQLSQYTQTKEAMNNQIIRDAQRLNLLPDLIANYTFNNGKWIFKATGQEASGEEVMNYVKGRGNQ